jgi:peroxiredoxin
MDSGTRGNSKLNILQLDETISDWNLLLTTNREASISSIVKNGSLLLIFIRGTWCPFCRLHLTRLREWVDKLSGKKATIIVVSSEPVDVVRDWLKKNSTPFIFASDEGSKLAEYFGVQVDGREFSQAATFLIDTNLSIRLAYAGKRTTKLFDEMEDSIKKVNN